MINPDILRYIDYSFLSVVVLFTLLTPKESEYYKLNRLIVGIFCVFIGIAETQIWMDIGRSVFTCLLVALIGGIFSYWFWPSSKKQVYLIISPLGQYISFLCASMAGFHIVDIFYGFSELAYTVVMVCFQMLLLMAASWGVVDGNHNRFNRWTRAFNTWLSSNFRSHG